jgi:HK97 gp10 family phage protein
MNVTFEFKGGADLAKALEQLSDRVARKVQREALTTAAEPLRARMASLAPHAPGAPDLRNTMVVSNARGIDTNEVAVAIGPSKAGYYGSFQEFGTARHSAQPFMRPALDETAETVLRVLADEMWDALKSRGQGLFQSGGDGGPVTGGSGGGGLL